MKQVQKGKEIQLVGRQGEVRQQQQQRRLSSVLHFGLRSSRVHNLLRGTRSSCLDGDNQKGVPDEAPATKDDSCQAVQGTWKNDEQDDSVEPAKTPGRKTWTLKDEAFVEKHLSDMISGDGTINCSLTLGNDSYCYFEILNDNVKKVESENLLSSKARQIALFSVHSKHYAHLVDQIKLSLCSMKSDISSLSVDKHTS
ncbi:hypothetical protein CAPTEDRAFT_190876 [Capitella teleta]|uniref:Uncharacterized protein n=1 Tax=Capitella teleta TaxID=283909 RepID=R7U9C4_CAPTE|nr:hypothetical protein CAPTEDRAFT_190876 [Capitella teleta]|eukprot:ELU00408.1 hypothetical protein CAPTEDRAFT_190876 [Capitella teleta]